MIHGFWKLSSQHETSQKVCNVIFLLTKFKYFWSIVFFNLILDVYTDRTFLKAPFWLDPPLITVDSRKLISAWEKFWWFSVELEEGSSKNKSQVSADGSKPRKTEHFKRKYHQLCRLTRLICGWFSVRIICCHLFSAAEAKN